MRQKSGKKPFKKIDFLLILITKSRIQYFSEGKLDPNLIGINMTEEPNSDSCSDEYEIHRDRGDGNLSWKCLDMRFS